MDSFMGIMAIDYDLQLLRLEMKILYMYPRLNIWTTFRTGKTISSFIFDFLYWI